MTADNQPATGATGAIPAVTRTGVPSSDEARARFHLVDQFFRTLRVLIRVGGFVACFDIGLGMVRALAGHETSVAVAVLVKVFVNLKDEITAALMIVLGGWGYGERQLRKRQVERWHSRIKRLETHINPDRSSSSLTPRGDTNPDDRDL